MSNKGSRKWHPTEEKERKPAESPVKDMKKKVAANAEKEKSTEKTAKSPERSEKHDKAEKTPNEKGDSKKVDKHATVPEKNTHADKAAKNAEKKDKHVEKKDKGAEKREKSTEKRDKTPENVDKSPEKSDKVAENTKVNDKKAEKPAEKKNEPEKVDTNGKDAPEKPQTATTNGNANGTDTVSDEPSSDEEELLIIDSQDEIFPELTYDESDVEVDDAPSRSFTRRSQVKATKTPETPRPASFKDDESKEKLLKVSESLATDRKLRSADSPKPETKKADKKESPKSIDLTEEDEVEKETEGQGMAGGKEKEGLKEASNLDVVVELETLEGESRPRTRARVSPYSRPKLDQTATSLQANYTGNNTTMEMDITETSSIMEEPSLDSSAYLRGLRTIRGRSSYKQLKELDLSHTSRTPRNTSLNASVLSDTRPINPVFGRKRKPSEEAAAPSPAPAPEPELTESSLHAHSKRMRLLDHFSVPFRGFNTRRAAEMCGINSDLPLTAPVAAAPDTQAPEPLKAGPAPRGPIAVPLPPVEHDPKRSCTVV